MRGRRPTLVLGLVVALVLPGNARAATDPILTSVYPYNGAILRSAIVPNITATYDQDLMGPPLSSINVTDGRHLPVRGDVTLSGPTSPTGGKRTIMFTPVTPFRESGNQFAFDIVVYAQGDALNRIEEPTIHFDIDDTAPLVPTILTPAQASSAKPQVTVSGVTSPFSIVRVSGGQTIFPQVPSDGSGDWSVTATMPEGVQTIWATAVDGAGNESARSSSVTLTVDGTVPAAPIITSPAPGDVIHSPNVQLRGTAEAGSTVVVSESGVAQAVTSAGLTGQWLANLTFEDGTHTLAVVAVDAAGNTSASTPLSFSVDGNTGAPKVTAPAEGALLASRTVRFAGTSMAGWTIRLVEQGALLETTTVAGDGSWAVNRILADGAHTVFASATDGVNESGATKRSFVVDSTAPAAPVFRVPQAGGVARGTNADISGTAEPRASVQLYEGAILRGFSTATSLGNWTVAMSLGEGQHTLKAYAVDRAGNVSAPATVTFTTDATNPTVEFTTPNGTVSAIEPFRVEGTATDDDRVVRVVLMYRNALGSLAGTENAVLDPIGGPEVRWHASGPTLRTGPYTVRAECYDRAGNLSSAKTITMIRV